MTHAQVAAWPAHKKACKERKAANQQAAVLQALQAARAQASRASAPPAVTAKQRRVCDKLQELQSASDNRGIAAMAREATRAAEELRAARHPDAAFLYSALGNAYKSQGQYGKAIEYHTQHLAIAQEVGDRAGEGRAYGNLGNAYDSQGQYGKAIEYHTQRLAIAKEVGDRAGEGRAYGSLGHSYVRLHQHVKAVSSYKAKFDICSQPDFSHFKAHAAWEVGMALWLAVRHDRGAASGDGCLQEPGPQSAISSSACQDGRLDEAERWLQTALGGGERSARLQLAYVAYHSRREDEAVGHLTEYLSMLVDTGRGKCRGCGQQRGEDAPMLTCSGCSVARFCNTHHQKMASSGMGQHPGRDRHKDICGLLKTWRQVAKGRVSSESCRGELLAFLGR